MSVEIRRADATPLAAVGDATQVFVRVPASTSNLGAGFDCVGMAIGRWLTVTAHTGTDAHPVAIARAGTLATLQCSSDDDLIWRGIVATSVALRRSPPTGLHLSVVSDIPVARGLGSSAAAVVAGVLLANELFGANLESDAVVDIAASLEGHPDNVAPSVLGGAVLSVRSGGHSYHSVPLTVHPSLRFAFLVPDFEVRTSVARAALPPHVEFDTAVTAASRAAALVAGLQTGDARLLSAALDDVLHVPFRHSLIPGYDHVSAAAIAAGAIGATLSGSGSTMVAVVHEANARRVSDAALAAWRSVGVTANAFVTAAEPAGAHAEPGSADHHPSTSRLEEE